MSISIKNTKKEIIDAYQALLKEHKSLAEQLKKIEMESKTITPKSSSTIVENLIKTQKDTPNTSIEGYHSLERVVEAFDSIKGSVGLAISGLSDTLTKEAANLAVLQQKTQEIETVLSELHQIDKADDTTLHLLIDDYIEKAEQFEKILSQTQKSQTELEQRIENDYEKAKNKHRTYLSEYKKEWQIKLDRENETYLYQRNLQRQQQKDEAQLLEKSRISQLEAFKEEKEKEWALHEKALTQKEESYAKVAEKAEELPKKLESEIKRSAESTKNAMLRDAKIKADLLAKENEGKKRIAERQIAALERKIAQQNEQLKTLNKQLSETLKEAKELAIKAIDGASGAKSLEALREVAMEQAKQSGKK